ncbi:MAG: methyltransferase domain-containing protein [Thermodesulfobacteriota bacterium]
MDPIKLPFDQYQRYRIITDAIEAVRDGKEPLKVLDVGGSPGLLVDFLPSDDIFIIDRVSSLAGDFVFGDGAALPFRNKAFDIVISVDVLEHIEPMKREAFIGELKRAANKYVFVAAPFMTEAVVEAEDILFDVIKAASGEEHAFLKEHKEYGLPEKTAITETLGKGAWQTISVPNGALKRWLPMMALSIYVTGDRFLSELSERINAFYNSNYYDEDNREPSYRYLIASARKGFTENAVKKIEGLCAEAGPEKELDLGWLSPLIDLLGYNKLKKARDAERREFKKVIEARDSQIKKLKESIAKKDDRIERQISGLKESIAKKDERIEKQKKTIRGSQGVIEELKKRLEPLENSLGIKALKGLGLTKKPK